MKRIIERLQRDILKLQKTVNKEGEDLLKKVKKIDLKKNIDEVKKEMEKILHFKFSQLEPFLDDFRHELRKSAKKAGIDLTKIETKLMAKANSASARIKSKTKSAAALSKKIGKKVKAKASKTAATAKKVAKKATGKSTPVRSTAKRSGTATGRKKSSSRKTKPETSN